jgi:hypothetical protein
MSVRLAHVRILVRLAFSSSPVLTTYSHLKVYQMVRLHYHYCLQELTSDVSATRDVSNLMAIPPLLWLLNLVGTRRHNYTVMSRALLSFCGSISRTSSVTVAARSEA